MAERRGCPVLAANYPACGCPDGECEVFDEFGMACDNCDHAGHRDAQGWMMMNDGSVWCSECASSETIAGGSNDSKPA